MAAPDTDITQDITEPRRFVIVGDDTLAFRLTNELTKRHRGRVMAVLPSSPRSRYGQRISKLEGVEVIDAEEVEGDPLAAADLATADALGLLARDDVTNIDAALRAHELNPGLRMVVRMYNTALGEGLAELPYCAVLSDSEIAAPAFVAAALNDTDGLYLLDETLAVTSRSEVRSTDILCGLARTDHGEPELLPADQSTADLVLVRASRRGANRVRSSRQRSHFPVRALAGRLWKRLRLVIGVFIGLLVAGAVVLASVRRDLSFGEAGYLATLDAFGGINPDVTLSIVEQVVQAVLGFAGVALIPVLTATAVDAVVKSRLDLRDGKLVRRASGHVVVAGLGEVGSHVLRLLADRGVDIIAIDSSPHAVGVQLARELRIPVIIGDASRPETLVAASVSTCGTLMAITSDDGTNLETGLVGRSLSRELPVVLRVFDADFADRIQKAFNIYVSRSVSYLAAPAFAARMVGQDLDTIAVGRHVLLTACLKVAAHSALEGQTVSDLRRPHRSWIVELTNTQGQRLAGVAASHRRLQRGDRLLVVATRRGLGQLIAEAQPLPDSVPRRIVLHDSSPFDAGPPPPRRP